jgi:hypothetical protein
LFPDLFSDLALLAARALRYGGGRDGFRVRFRLAKKTCSPEPDPKVVLGTAPERLIGEERRRGKAGTNPRRSGARRMQADRLRRAA